MRQVAAAAQIHTQHRVARFTQRHIGGEVRLRTAVGLHIGEFCAEQRLRAFNADFFHLIHKLAAAIVAVSRIALGIFIGEHRAHGRHRSGRNDVLRSNQLQIPALTAELRFNQIGDGRIGRAHACNILLNHNFLFPP